MKAIKVIWGLIYDDPWLFWGILVSLALIRLATAAGWTGPGAGVLLCVLLFAGVCVSVGREARKKRGRRA
jgi:hypothetical protein